MATVPCVYCGQRPGTTDDHVPPKGLFPSPRPSNLVSVPSCPPCHRGFSKDDEYFRLALSMRWDTSEAAREPRDAAMRGLYRPQGQRFMRSFIRGVREVELRSPAGLFVGRRAATTWTWSAWGRSPDAPRTHTVAAYRDAFCLLLRFAQGRTGKPPHHLALEDIDAPLIGAFLHHIEADRGVSARTRNARLTAIRSLFNFAAYRHPEHGGLIQRVLAIPPKRTSKTLVTYLTEEEMAAPVARWKPSGARASAAVSEWRSAAPVSCYSPRIEFSRSVGSRF